MSAGTSYTEGTLMDVIIRPATLQDRDLLFDLVVQFATSFTPQRAAFESSLERLLANDEAHLLVATHDNTLIGYCLGFVHDTFYANGPVAWVEEIMVQEAFRRHHIGQHMMETFEQWAASQGGATLIALATRRASSFYKSIGYDESASYFRKLLPRPYDDLTSAD
jgi:GNAT superfamily N-acetyltransferase